MQRRILFTTPARAGILSAAPLAAITIGATGAIKTLNAGNLTPDLLNPAGTTDAIIDSAIAGWLYGWDCPAARLALDFEAELAARPEFAVAQSLYRAQEAQPCAA